MGHAVYRHNEDYNNHPTIKNIQWLYTRVISEINDKAKALNRWYVSSLFAELPIFIENDALCVVLYLRAFGL